MSDETVQDSSQKLEQEINAAESAAEEVVDGEAVETEAAEPTLEERLAQAEAKAQENLEGWQRARAEFANARKRFDKQRVDARRNAQIEIAEKLLPVLDDFALAFASVPDTVSNDDWFGGVELIPRKMSNILEGIGIVKIESIGASFDPMLHNAIMREDSAEYESDTVIKEYQAGYKVGEHVVRPALVVVAA